MHEDNLIRKSNKIDVITQEGPEQQKQNIYEDNLLDNLENSFKNFNKILDNIEKSYC